VLVASLEKRSAELKDLAPEARSAAIARATRIVEEKIRPAYVRVQGFMAELHPKTNDTAGISRLQGGLGAYGRALANFTSTSLSADEIHAIGLREVARLEGEMDKHLRSLGFVEGSIEARMKALDATFQPKGEGKGGEDPRPAILAQYKAMVQDALVRSASLFNLKPRAPVEVLREPPLTEASAAAHYSRPGVFWVPMRGPGFDMIRMRSLSCHEAVPGHHFQLAIQQELAGIPKFRSARIFSGGSAHSEGWALYTERLAVEQGWYGDEKRGDYGVNVEEVDRYVVWPGQATAYMIGMLRIVELREKAKAALGAGSVPLDVLGQLVDGWIAKEKAKA
jgi:uncharacterized protein (DUF885 family)